MTGNGGLLDTARAGQLVIECSTLPVDDKQRGYAAVKNAGLQMLDCPLSGTGAQAATGDLLVFASGEQSLFEQARPILAGFSRGQRYVGTFGNGSRIKLIANLLVHIHNVAAAEALVLGRKAGLNPELLLDVLADSAGASRMLQIRGPLMVERCYRPATMKLDIWRKDMALIAGFADELDCPAPLFTASAELYRAALAQGRGDEDTAAVHEVLATLAHLQT